MAMVRLNEEGLLMGIKEPSNPIAAIVYSTNGTFTDVVYDNEIWTVATHNLNKGGTYASKTD